MKILHEGYNYNNKAVDQALENLEQVIPNEMRYKMFDVRDGGTRIPSVVVKWVTQEEYDEEMLEDFKAAFETDVLPTIIANSTNIEKIIVDLSFRGYSDDVDRFTFDVNADM